MKRWTMASMLAVTAITIAVACVARAGKDAPKEGGTAVEKIRIYSVEKGGYVEVPKIEKSDAEWKQELPPETYKVTREEGTERAFTGKSWNEHREGVYRCADCGTDLYLSTAKFESGTGWPSFWQPVDPANVATREDSRFFMKRTEVHCPRCGAHLGHVFPDGPKPTGLRYCMNSAALEFVPEKVPAEKAEKESAAK